MISATGLEMLGGDLGIELDRVERPRQRRVDHQRNPVLPRDVPDAGCHFVHPLCDNARCAGPPALRMSMQ